MSAKEHRVSISIKPSSDAKETVELEHTHVILSDLSKKSPEEKGDLKSRALHVIKSQRDLKATMQKINPKIKISVPNLLADDPGAKMEMELSFSEMKDFHPDEIVKKVKPLQELMAARERLKKLKMVMLKDPALAKTVGNVLNSGGDPREMLFSKLGL